MLETYWADFFDPKDPLMSFRKKGWDRFKEIGVPHPRQEAFQYLSKEFAFPKPTMRKSIAIQPVTGLSFVDGFFETSQVPSPLVCLPLENGIRSYALFLQNRLTRTLKEETDPIAALNGAFQGRGAFLYVPPQCKAVLHLAQIFTCDGMASPRLHIYLGRNSQLELTQSSKGKSGFCNHVFDMVLDEGAELMFCDRAEGHCQAIRATLKRNSRLKTVLLGKGVRTSIKIQLSEENSEVQLFGLARLEGDAEFHIHAVVDHMAPYTRSRQHFKSALKEKSRFSFEGKIFVRMEAQKTEAYQLNNNLVLSEEASANAKPTLEIFADDVKASHGATVGQLDEEQLFYLRSRGLGFEQAREWLIQGFCQEILNHAR